MAYTYDEAGNRNSLTVTGTENYVTNYTYYDKKYRLLKTSKRNSGADYIDVTDYTYDNNGNQIRTDSSRQGLTPKFEIGLYAPDEDSGYGYEIFTYNGLNQLVKYEDEMSNKAEYTYMANGLRLSKTVNGDKTSFLWDGDQIMATITSDETRSYTRAPGYIRTGTSKERSSLEKNDKFYLFNGHGDVTGITDKSGNLEKSYEYDAFGNEINPSKNDTNPFRYCGEYYDEETESIYLRARYYTPSTGRFTVEDPIKDGLNWYAYCGGNPVVSWDPNGLATMSNTDKKAIEKAQKQYQEAEANNDYVGMNKAHKVALAINQRYDSNYKDNYDYTHGGKLIAVGSYSIFNGPNVQTTTGTVYFVKDTTNDQRIAKAQSIETGDFVCIDQRNAENPNIKVINSVKANNKQIEKVVDILSNYEKTHPSNWDRSIGSLYNEWLWHNYINMPAHLTDALGKTDGWVDRTKDVDLDNGGEKVFPAASLPDFGYFIN